MEKDPVMASAIEAVSKILKIVSGVLDPVERRMQIEGWQPEYRAILWEAIGRDALDRAGKLGTKS